MPVVLLAARHQKSVYIAWLDNVIAKTLSNHHGVISVDKENSMMWRGKGKGRAMSSTDKRVLSKVPPKYNKSRMSQSHNWAPKLVFQMFTMELNNAYVCVCVCV
jgi:hypothetical protein